MFCENIWITIHLISNLTKDVKVLLKYQKPEAWRVKNAATKSRCLNNTCLNNPSPNPAFPFDWLILENGTSHVAPNGQCVVIVVSFYTLSSVSLGKPCKADLAFNVFSLRSIKSNLFSQMFLPVINKDDLSPQRHRPETMINILL